MFHRYLDGQIVDGSRIVAIARDPAKVADLASRGVQVRQGDLLPNHRVDEITPQGMRLTYLPLNETQRLLFGSTP